jgi:hypothetical protein
MLKYFINNFTDTSLENFLSELHECIINDECQNSFKTFKYKKITKNKLYKAIENYKNNGNIFYSKLTTNNTGIAIKRIGEIKMGECCVPIGNNIKGVVPNGWYHLEFTVYYDKQF